MKTQVISKEIEIYYANANQMNRGGGYVIIIQNFLQNRKAIINFKKCHSEEF